MVCDPSRFFKEREKHKRETIETLFKDFPRRKFILIGDCGEKDPEIYGDLMRRYPKQVDRILLRDPSDEGNITERLQAALRDIPSDRWQVFKDAAEVKANFK